MVKKQNKKKKEGKPDKKEEVREEAKKTKGSPSTVASPKEIFEVKKDHEEKIIEVKGVEKEKEISEKDKKKQIEKENRILRNIFIFIGVLILIIILWILFIKSIRQFDYKGVKFEVVKEGDLILYHTSFPVIYQGELAEYNIYLRNDPRELEKEVPATGTLVSIDDTVINITQEFKCDGDEIIAIANLVNLYNALGKDIMQDENASCDVMGRYMFLQIQPGNTTSIEKFGLNCYNLNVNNCKILEVTERFITGMLVRINAE